MLWNREFSIEVVVDTVRTNLNKGCTLCYIGLREKVAEMFSPLPWFLQLE